MGKGKAKLLFEVETLRKYKVEIVQILNSLNGIKLHENYYIYYNQVKILSDLINGYLDIIERDFSEDYYGTLRRRLEDEALELLDELSGLRQEKEFKKHKFGWKAYKTIFKVLSRLYTYKYVASPEKHKSPTVQKKIDTYKQLLNIDITKELHRGWSNE